MSGTEETGTGSGLAGGDPLEALFRRLGADAGQAVVCARQLRKRAAQIAAERGVPEETAMGELLARVTGMNQTAASQATEAPPIPREPA